MRKIALWLVCLGLTCCQKHCGSGRDDLSPEQVVEAYLEISLNMTDPAQKEQLLELTTGVLRSSINNASNETITNAFIKKNYHLVRYSVMERRDRTPRETEITFLLVYKDLGDKAKNIKKEDAPEVSTENTVAVIKEKGAWFMRDVIGKRTTIDFPVTDEIIKPGTSSPEPETTPPEPP